MAYAQFKESVPESAQKVFLLWRIDCLKLVLLTSSRDVIQEITAVGLAQSVERFTTTESGGFDSRDRTNTQDLKITEK